MSWDNDKFREREERFLSMGIAAIRDEVNDEGYDDKIMEKYCIDCGELIPISRLKVVPNTCRCVKCQNLIERRNRR